MRMMRRPVSVLILLLLMLVVAAQSSAGVQIGPESTDLLSRASFTIPATTGSLLVWWYPDFVQTNNAWQQVIHIVGGGGANNFDLMKYNDNKLYAGWTTGATSYRVEVASGSYTLNQFAWNALIVTWDDVANETRLYLNGTLIGTASTLVTWNTSAETLWVGNHGGLGGFANGQIAEIAFYNVVLSTLNISTLSTQLPNCVAGATNYWSLPNISTLTDAVGGATLTNSGAVNGASHPSLAACGITTKPHVTGGGMGGPKHVIH